MNLTTHSSYDRLQEEVELIRVYKPSIVITALGGPEPVIDAVHDYGGTVIADVNSVKYARKAMEKGVDGLALVCSGAGGHTGSMSPFAFIQEVRSFFDGLIVLSGSIGSGQAIRAAEVLGADFCYMGTSFIAAKESLASSEYQEMLIAANFDDLVLSDALTGAKAYYLRACLEKMGINLNELKASNGVQLSNSQGKIMAWKDIWSAGHGVGEIKSVKSVADIVTDLSKQYDNALQVKSKRSRIPNN